MTRVLKTSGFAGLIVMMVVGLYQSVTLAGGDPVPAWMVGSHAHLGVLSILAIVLGFAIPALEVTGRLRQLVTWTFVVGQWALPATPALAAGAGLSMLHPTSLLWGGLLIVSMAIMTWQAATYVDEPTAGERGGPDAAPADD